LDCIGSVYKSTIHVRFEIWVVDNGSNDGSVQAVKEGFPGVCTIENHENKGFSAAVNQALNKCNAKYYILLNTDAILRKATVKTLYEFMEDHKEVGIAGGQLQNPDGTMQHSFDNYPALATELLNKSLLKRLFPNKYLSKKSIIKLPIEVESVIGACIIIRDGAIKQVGKLDEDYFFFIEETDWCYRMRKAGWKVYYVPDAKVTHLGGQSKKKAPWQVQIEYCRSLYIFFKKNRSFVTYALFRVFYVIKILMNLIINFVGNLFIIFLNQRLRYRLLIYYRLLLWHLLFCPSWMGLRSVKKQN